MENRLADKVWTIYSQQIRNSLAKIADTIPSEVWDATDEEYALSVSIPGGVLTIELTEERIREGEGDGLAWNSAAVKDGGEIIGQCAPLNYTTALWTTDMSELDRRLYLMLKAWESKDWSSASARKAS